MEEKDTSVCRKAKIDREMVEMQAFRVLVCNRTEMSAIQKGHKRFRSAYRNITNAQNKRRRKRKWIKQKVRNMQRRHLSI